MKVYIAGPMSGLTDLNYPAFMAAEADWQHEGWEVFNPARNFDPNPDYRRSDCLRVDIPQICQSDAIAFLPGWEKSIGAQYEMTVAGMLDLPKYDAHTFLPLKAESILMEAERLVGGTRQSDYGHPIEDFTRTGRMWGAILGTPDVPPDKVALCMVALKISREVNKPKRDNRVDGCGYFRTLDMVRERQSR